MHHLQQVVINTFTAGDSDGDENSVDISLHVFLD